MIVRVWFLAERDFMKETNSFSQKLKQFVLLFFPIFVTQMSLFAMSFFDTTMSGHASPIDLAGVAIGTSIWIPVSTGLTGILMATTQLLHNSLDLRKRRMFLTLSYRRYI